MEIFRKFLTPLEKATDRITDRIIQFSEGPRSVPFNIWISIALDANIE